MNAFESLLICRKLGVIGTKITDVTNRKNISLGFTKDFLQFVIAPNRGNFLSTAQGPIQVEIFLCCFKKFDVKKANTVIYIMSLKTPPYIFRV